MPQLVSWNGGGFDLPVLHYRGLRHGVVAGKYWDMGDDDREFKYNNYISRYHLRHLDLMDLLAMYQPRANAPLDAMAKLCGFPGKLGMDGSQVYARLPRRPPRGDPPLLRDRRDEHLPAVLPLPEDARRLQRGRTTGARSPSCATRWRRSASRTGWSTWRHGRWKSCAPAQRRRLRPPPGHAAAAPAMEDAGAGPGSGARRDRRDDDRDDDDRDDDLHRRLEHRARSRRASPGADWSCGSGRPSRRR